MMNYLRNLMRLCLLIPLFLMYSCENSVTPTCSYALELEAETNALSAAASAYGQDPTAANCEAYRQAFMNYLDAAEKLDNCVPQSERAAYRQTIDSAQDSLTALAC